MNVIPVVLSLFILVGMVFGSRTETTSVSAYARSGVTVGKRFILQGPDPRFPGGDPGWPGYSRILTRALEAKGYVPDASSPDLVIRVGYRVGDTQIWTAAATTPITGVTTGAVAPVQSPYVASTNTRVIEVEALDAASVATGKPTVVWSTRGRSRGAEDNLAQVFPMMVAAMEDYFGATAANEVSVSKTRSDPEVARLQQP